LEGLPVSVDLYALCISRLPAKTEWQAAIEQQHFPLKMDPVFDPTKDTGFWPAQLNGTTAGFEYYPLTQAEWKVLPNLERPDRFIAGAQFSIGSRPLEFVSAVWVAVAVARACDGVVYDPQESKSYTGAAMDGLVAQASMLLKMQVPRP